MKYTNPRLLLKVNEVDLYDLMLKTSQLLKEMAEGGTVELHQIMVGEILPLESPVPDRARDGLHKMLAYAFTMGVSFAVERQVEAGAAFLKHLEKQKES